MYCCGKQKFICIRSTSPRCFGHGGHGGSVNLLFLERGKEDEWSWEVGGGGVFGSGLGVRTNGKQLSADNKNSIIRNVTHISHHSGSKSVSSSRKEVVWYQNAKTVTGVSWTHHSNHRWVQVQRGRRSGRVGRLYIYTGGEGGRGGW